MNTDLFKSQVLQIVLIKLMPFSAVTQADQKWPFRKYWLKFRAAYLWFSQMVSSKQEFADAESCIAKTATQNSST